MNIIQRIQQNDRLRLSGILLLSALFTSVLIFGRVMLTQKVTFVFLIWNLILAFVPFVLSTLLVSFRHQIKSDFLLGAGIILWLLFFPNAPYILTDFFHLKARPGVPIWFDLMVILSAAWNGLILGLISLKDMQELVEDRLSKFWGWTFVISSLLLCGFGIYVGRYLRWNSWDVLTNPFALAQDLLARFTNPLVHPRSFGVTFLYMAFLLIAFLFFKQLNSTNRQPNNLL